MVRLHRLGLGLLLCALSLCAFAYTCTQYRATACNGACAGAWGSDKLGAVVSLQTSLNASGSTVFCNAQMTGDLTWKMDSGSASGVGMCGTNTENVGGYHATTGTLATRNGDYCSDPSCTGLGVRVNPTTHVCEVQPDAFCADTAVVNSTSGYYAKANTTGSTPVGSGSYCEPKSSHPLGGSYGCTVNFSREISYQTPTGWESEGWVTQFTSASAAGPSVSCNASTTTTVGPDTCPGGQPGTVNGVTVCIPFSPETPKTTSSTTSGTTTTASPGGTVVTPGQTISTTTCGSDGNCVTTSTTTSGSTTTTTQSTTDKNTYCAAHASDKQCEGTGIGGTGSGSKFWGACSGTGGFGTFDCTGDAALCAAAKAVNEMDCALRFDGTASEVSAYGAAKAASGVTGLGSETTAISSSSFDQSNALGGTASCIADRTITIDLKNVHKTIVLPFSVVCSQLSPLGNILLAVSFLTGMMIVFRRTA